MFKPKFWVSVTVVVTVVAATPLFFKAEPEVLPEVQASVDPTSPVVCDELILSAKPEQLPGLLHDNWSCVSESLRQHYSVKEGEKFVPCWELKPPECPAIGR